jgi:hypothetical protein
MSKIKPSPQKASNIYRMYWKKKIRYYLFQKKFCSQSFISYCLNASNIKGVKSSLSKMHVCIKRVKSVQSLIFILLLDIIEQNLFTLYYMYHVCMPISLYTVTFDTYQAVSKLLENRLSRSRSERINTEEYRGTAVNVFAAVPKISFVPKY